MRRLALALLGGLTFGAWIGYRLGWLDGADYVEDWAATEADDIADLCDALDCTPNDFRRALAEACARLDAREVVH